MHNGDPVREERPKNTNHYQGTSPKTQSIPRLDLSCRTCGRPCPLSASWRSCLYVCDKCGLSAFPPCPVHTASSLGQRVSWPGLRFAGRAAARWRSPPPAAGAPWAAQVFLLWLYATLAPAVWKGLHGRRSITNVILTFAFISTAQSSGFQTF